MVDEIYSEIRKRRKEEEREKRKAEKKITSILIQCNDLAKEFDGIKATAAKENNGRWVIEYIALFGADPQPYQSKLSEYFGEIEMVEKKCDYETAERIYLA